MLRLAIVTASVVCIGILIWVVGVFTYIGFLSGTTYSNRPTDTVQTRTLSFRGKPPPAQSSNSDERVRTWSLSVPTAYVRRELGSNWAGSYHVDLDMLVNVETLQLAPKVDRGPPPSGFMEFKVALNNKAFGNRGSSGSCFDEQDRDDRRPPRTSSSIPRGIPNVRGCDTALCPFYISYKGWEVEALVRQEQYIEKAKYCSLTERLLTQWTDRIESLAD